MPASDCFLCLSLNFGKFLERLWETALFMYKLQNFNQNFNFQISEITWEEVISNGVASF